MNEWLAELRRGDDNYVGRGTVWKLLCRMHSVELCEEKLMQLRGDKRRIPRTAKWRSLCNEALTGLSDCKIGPHRD